MKQLKFDHRFAEEIKDGTKTVTFRVNDDKDIKPGDVLQLVDKVDQDRPISWEITGEITIKEVSQASLDSLTKKQLIRGESFSSKDEMIQTFRRFYGEHIDAHTLVTVLSFEFKKLDSPVKFLENANNKEATTSIISAKLYADGGSRGNPGPSALGFVVLDESGETVHSDNKYIGLTTNNQAEYHALLAGMEWCLEHGVRELNVFLDSMLVINQLKGIFKVKNRELWSLYETAKERLSKFKTVKFTHIPRELNKLADAEVNKALDAVKGTDVVQ